MRLLLLLLGILLSRTGTAQDNACIKVHFIYGSKPARHYRHAEKKWFGGKLGGHVGIEGDSDRILNFFPKGRFHVFGQQYRRHSTYAEFPLSRFDGYFKTDSLKKTIVIIPVTAGQKRRFDSLSAAYLQQTPYDYAFFGMRCGAASYEVLAQLGILPAYSRDGTVWRIFYPRKLRTRLLRQAGEEGWTVIRQRGTRRRIWERDPGKG